MYKCAVFDSNLSSVFKKNLGYFINQKIKQFLKPTNIYYVKVETSKL